MFYLDTGYLSLMPNLGSGIMVEYDACGEADG